MKFRLFSLIAVVVGVLVPLLFAEIALRFLPTNIGLMAMPVSAADPVFHFVSNDEGYWSKDWNFLMVNRVRTNNAGFVNDQDYDAKDCRPLLAVVGDSMVEALMVPYRVTLQGRLAAASAANLRVYSFAASGSSLSQFLIWAREARQHWGAQGLVIVVTHNVFDTSLARYKVGPGFHHYVARPDGELTLHRFDYQPSRLRGLIKHSALARYLIFNLQIKEHIQVVIDALTGLARAAESDDERVSASEDVVRAFFRDLNAIAAWKPGQVLFVVDGIRYPEDAPALTNNYFGRVRTYFLEQAREQGYETIDLDPVFFARYRARHERYDFPGDAHWNGIAHGVVANAVLKSSVYAKTVAASAAPCGLQENRRAN